MKTVENTAKEKVYGYAYYADEEFLGWYGDSWGTVSKFPKLYSDLNTSSERVTRTVKRKLEKVNETTFDEAVKSANDTASQLRLLYFSSEDTLRGKNVQVRVVEFERDTEWNADSIKPSANTVFLKVLDLSNEDSSK